MPTAESPLLILCTGCGGDGGMEASCATCHGRGREELAGCPWEQVPADVWQALEAAKQEKKGHWPLAGGWLEQTRICLDAVEQVREVESRFVRRPEAEE